MVELPRWDRRPDDAESSLDRIGTWLRALLDSGIISSFGGDESRWRRLGTQECLAEVERFASDHWDFRGGRERNLAADATFTPTQRRLVESVGRELGLLGTAPPARTYYDAVVMTGGMIRAGIVKPRFLRELEAAGLDWWNAVFLGASRQFKGDEIELARELQIEGSNEIDAMTVGMQRAFDLGEPDRDSSGGAGLGLWLVRSWDAGEREFSVVAAPSSEPELRRANTADTFRFWAGGEGTGCESVLVITTPVYVPYQGAVAVEVFGIESGMSVETVAVSDTANDLGPLTQVFLDQHVLQELRSAIHGFSALYKTLQFTRSNR
ncbi:MAG: hypothetical protein KF772_00355 [Cryobacterium sp.]|nr:hypothetical protein [Cryobacterium sp.]